MKRRGVEHRALPVVHRFEKRFRRDMPRQNNRSPDLDVEHDGDEKVMRHRQTPDHRVVRRDAEGFVRRENAITDGFVRECDSLPRARCARGEADEREVESVIIRRRGGVEFGEKAIRRDGHAVSAWFRCQDSRQQHRLGDFLDLFLWTFRRHWNDHESQPPQRESQRDVGDAVRESQPHATAIIYMQRLNMPRQFADLPRQFAIGDDRTFLYERRLLRPT